MGGLFSAPAAPVQSNEAEMMMVREQARQNDLLYAQAEEARVAQTEANEAAAENLREIEIRDAEAAAEADEREERAKKGKKDLLYRTSLGVEDEDDADFLRLGGA